MNDDLFSFFTDDFGCVISDGSGQTHCESCYFYGGHSEELRLKIKKLSILKVRLFNEHA